jgi:hypothetical protein
MTCAHGVGPVSVTEPSRGGRFAARSGHSAPGPERLLDPHCGLRGSNSDAVPTERLRGRAQKACSAPLPSGYFRLTFLAGPASCHPSAIQRLYARCPPTVTGILLVGSASRRWDFLSPCPSAFIRPSLRIDDERLVINAPHRTRKRQNGHPNGVRTGVRHTRIDLGDGAHPPIILARRTVAGAQGVVTV